MLSKSTLPLVELIRWPEGTCALMRGCAAQEEGQEGGSVGSPGRIFIKHIASQGRSSCREEKGKAVMQPQHTAIMVEPDEVSSSTPCSSSASAPHSHHSRSVRPPAGAFAVPQLPQSVQSAGGVRRIP